MELVLHVNAVARTLEKLVNATYTLRLQQVANDQGIRLVPVILGGGLALYIMARLAGVRLNANVMRKISGATMVMSATALLVFTKASFSLVCSACCLGSLMGYTVYHLTQPNPRQRYGNLT